MPSATLARCSITAGGSHDADRTVRRAVSLSEALVAADGASARDADALAESLSVLFLVRERSPEATGLLRRAIELSERAERLAPADSDESRDYRNHLAGHLSLLSRRTDRDLAERLDLLQRARQVYADLAKTKPGEADYRFNLAQVDLEIARLRRDDWAAGPGTRVVPQGRRGRRADRPRGPTRGYVQVAAGRESERAGRAARS